MIKPFKFFVIIVLMMFAPFLQARSINWSALTTLDVTHVHATLQNDSIVPYVNALPAQKIWLKKGYLDALKAAEVAHSYQDYVTVLEKYINGFAQPHLYLTELKKIKNQSSKSGDFYIKTKKNGAVWVSLPNFEPHNVTQTQVLEKIIHHIVHYRHAKEIIFDVRNNPGGDSSYYRRLLINLYGKPFLRSLGKSFLWNQQWVQIWRVSRENLNAISPAVSVYSPIKKALQEKRAIYYEKWFVIDQQGPINQHNPVTAKIYVLTNRQSYSSSWLFTRIIKQLPNGEQIGEPTAINSYYGEPRTLSLHHGLMLTFPIGANLKPNNDFGSRLVPSISGNVVLWS